MRKFTMEEVRRSESSTEFYRSDWAEKNIKIAQYSWSDGPAPFGTSLWPRYYSEVKRHGEAWFRFRNAADMTFEILLDGALEYTQDGISETVHPGELYIMHEGSDITFRADRESYFHRLRLTFYGSMLRNLDQEFGLAGRRVVPLRNAALLSAEFRRMGMLLKEQEAAKGAEISASAYRIIAEVAKECSRPDAFPELLREILGDMKGDLGLKRSIREIAAHHGVEVHTLMRLFRKHLGLSPREYLIQLRMEAAKHLVGSSELSMKEIAGRLGYCNSLYFSTVFHRLFHETPSRYRKRKRRSIGE